MRRKENTTKNSYSAKLFERSSFRVNQYMVWSGLEFPFLFKYILKSCIFILKFDQNPPNYVQFQFHEENKIWWILLEALVILTKLETLVGKPKIHEHYYFR